MYLPGTICDSALYYWYLLNVGVDYYQFKHSFFVSLSTREVFNLTVLVKFTMNYTTSIFDMTYSINQISILNASSRINTFLLTNNILLMQSNSTGAMYLYNVGTSSLGTVKTNIPTYQTFTFFFKFNVYYLLQSYGLI